MSLSENVEKGLNEKFEVVQVYCRKENRTKWLSIPLQKRATLFNEWLKSL